MRYMLDTNIISDLVKNPGGSVAGHIRRVGADAVCTSVIVAAELRYGVSKKGSPVLSERVEAILQEIPVLPFDLPADARYGALRAALETKGQPIGGNDLLIAAHAATLGKTVVTANVSEFARVSELSVENWLE